MRQKAHGYGDGPLQFDLFFVWNRFVQNLGLYLIVRVGDHFCYLRANSSLEEQVWYMVCFLEHTRCQMLLRLHRRVGYPELHLAFPTRKVSFCEKYSCSRRYGVSAFGKCT